MILFVRINVGARALGSKHLRRYQAPHLLPPPNKELKFKEVRPPPLNSLHPPRPTVDDGPERLRPPGDNPAELRRRRAVRQSPGEAGSVNGGDGSSADVSGARTQEEELKGVTSRTQVAEKKARPLRALRPPLRSPADRNSRRGGSHQK